MDLLEASTSLERIELLAKITHVDEVTSKDKTVALTWIAELAEEIKRDVGKRLIKEQSEHNI
jgi:hypothetical protein